MATYHCSCGKCNKGKGSSAAASYDYISRERKYKVKEGFLCGESGNLPEWCGGRAREYWYQADRNERANSNVARKLEFALPNEITDIELQKQLVRDVIAKACNGDKLAWSYAIHTTATGNIHAHVMISERSQDDVPRTPAQFFKRGNKKNPKKGGCRKTEFLKKREFVKYIRKEVADLVNALYESQRIEARVDERSYADQGIDKVPSVHMGPQLKEMEERGVESYVLADRREKSAERAAVLAEERTAAAMSGHADSLKQAPDAEIRQLMAEYEAYAAKQRKSEERRRKLEEKKRENARREQADSKYSSGSETVNAYLSRMGMDTAELKFLAKGKKALYFLVATGDGSEPVVHFRPSGSGLDDFAGAGAFFSKTENTYTTRTDLSYFDPEVKRLTKARKEAERVAAELAAKAEAKRREEADNRYSKISEHVRDFLKRAGRTVVELKFLAKGKKSLYFTVATGDGSAPVVYFSPSGNGLDNFVGVAASFDTAENVYIPKTTLSDFNSEVTRLTEERKEAERKAEAEMRAQADNRYSKISEHVRDFLKRVGKTVAELKFLAKGKESLYFTAATGDGSEPVVYFIPKAEDLESFSSVAASYNASVRRWWKKDSMADYNSAVKDLTAERRRAEIQAAQQEAEKTKRRIERETDERYSDVVTADEYCQENGLSRIEGKIVGRGKDHIYLYVAVGDGSAPVVRVNKSSFISDDDVAVTFYGKNSVYGKSSTAYYDLEVKKLERKYLEERKLRELEAVDRSYSNAASAADYCRNAGVSLVYLKILDRGKERVYCAVPAGDGDAPVVWVDKDCLILDTDVAVSYFASSDNAIGTADTSKYDAEVKRLEKEHREEEARKAAARAREADERYKNAPDAADLYFEGIEQLPLKIIARGSRYVYCEVPVGEGDVPVVRVSSSLINSTDAAVTYHVTSGKAEGESSTSAYDSEVLRLRAAAESKAKARSEVATGPEPGSAQPEGMLQTSHERILAIAPYGTYRGIVLGSPDNERLLIRIGEGSILALPIVMIPLDRLQMFRDGVEVSFTTDQWGIDSVNGYPTGRGMLD